MAVDDRRRQQPGAIRVSTWRGDQRVAVVSPAPDRPSPTPAAVAVELDLLRRSGFQRAVTSALHQHELGSFLDNGFVEQERLHLLRHDLIDLPPTDPSATIRRGRRRDRARVLELDERAFDAFWTLDARGLDDAIRATPTSRFRVAWDDRAVTGYSVTGIAGTRGYLQRLAVNPDQHGQGLGTALVAESLRWLQRSGGRHAIVNTQFHNEPALRLYRRCGFVPEPDWLTVLNLPLVAPDPGPGPGDRR
jgi:ribosomal protein S18 acetylase RimI-like enzyme